MVNRFEDNTAWRRALRRDCLARREALSPAEHARLSGQIIAHLGAALPWAAGTVVGFCWPIRNEPDLRPAFAQGPLAACRAALPVVLEKGSALAFRPWQAGMTLVDDEFGIPTPPEGPFITPDVLLLPLNAFDAAGYRLGYGGGFFDRTLAQLSPRPLAIGVGFELGRVPSIRPEAHDQRLDWIVTEAGAFQAT